MAALVARSLAKSYRIGGGGELAVLVDCSLTMDRSETAAVLGPSGSGKSTLLAILGTLDCPTSGSLAIDGADPFALDEPALAAFRGRHVGFVFQEHHLLPQCSALENVLAPLLAEGSAGADDVRRAEELLDRVGLAARRYHRPAELSGGERQRTALARALIRRPTLLVADEPTGNLDRSTAAGVVDLMLELERETNAVLIVATHSEALAARMGRRYELEGGRLAERT